MGQTTACVRLSSKEIGNNQGYYLKIKLIKVDVNRLAYAMEFLTRITARELLTVKL